MDADPELKNVAIKCSSNEEEESAIEYFLSCGYKLPDDWSVKELSSDSREYPYIAIYSDEFVTAFPYVNDRVVFQYSEFFKRDIKYVDYDMIL